MCRLKVAQCVVTTLEQLDAHAAVAVRHLIPAQHLVALGDHGKVALQVRQGCWRDVSQFGDELGPEEKAIVAVPCREFADVVGEVSGRIDRGVQHHRTAAQPLGHCGGIKATERTADHGGGWRRPVCDLVEHHLHRLGRRGRQLRAPPAHPRPVPCHPRCRDLRLGRLRRRTKAVQVKQLARRLEHRVVQVRTAPSASSSLRCTPPNAPLLMHSTWSPGRAAATTRRTSSSTESLTTASGPIGASA